MTSKIDAEKQARQEWITKIQQGQVLSYKGNCLKCGKPFEISSQRSDDNSLEMTPNFDPGCVKADHDPEIREMMIKALETQPRSA